ncbi:hypothetical protein LSH36_3g10015 [Paralvinella palmiformis]|uniref:Uncharacterized protein n=1 Tax=Paralvinella palmiformis TaxID=53620 RepID=A0AAD9KFT7_9ANNE|nr:hypothetical protein LSH36_3g10015 [Paralvinella palmiformis]
MTTGLLTSSINNLFQKKLSKPTEPNITKYKTFNKLYNTTSRQLKIRYYDEVFNSNKHNIKQTWIELRKLLEKQNDKNICPDFFIINNKKVTDKTEIAELCYNYFVNVGKNVQSKIPKQN